MVSNVKRGFGGIILHETLSFFWLNESEWKELGHITQKANEVTDTLMTQFTKVS